MFFFFFNDRFLLSCHSYAGTATSTDSGEDLLKESTSSGKKYIHIFPDTFIIIVVLIDMEVFDYIMLDDIDTCRKTLATISQLSLRY